MSVILIIGGYGVFGGNLAKALAQDPSLDVIIAGRSLKKAESFAKANGGRSAVIDLAKASLHSDIAALAADIVIDAAGPYQAYGAAPYRVAEAAIACGAHYLDLSDDAAFTEGISALDRRAKAASVAALSGVSSVPALSSAAVTALAQGIDDIHLIESAILPGNKAPRGRSVICSILSQSGQPLPVWRGGAWGEARGWGDRKRIDLSAPGTPPLKGRWASLIGAPDLTLFPKAFRARSVLFRAGLDLKLMHGGLSALSWLVRLKLLRNLTPLTGPLKWAADWLKPFGSDRGGMSVDVTGADTGRTFRKRRWTLIVGSGDGPHIPSVPAQILVRKLLNREIDSGARACLAEFTLAEAEQVLARYDVAVGRSEEQVTPIFQSALGGEAFATLPGALQDLHSVIDKRIWRGEAEITRGAGLLSRIAGWLAGFPKAGQRVPVTVTQTKTATGEDWVREFGSDRFVSHLRRSPSAKQNMIEERFGLMRFAIKLHWDGEALHYPVTRGSILGVPLPRFMLPRSQTKETIGQDGASQFDVNISLPIAGQIVHYRGWLKPQ